MDAALDGLALQGLGRVTLWVLAANARARRFYEGAGVMEDDAGKTEQYAGATITEVRYRRTLAGRPG